MRYAAELGTYQDTVKLEIHIPHMHHPPIREKEREQLEPTSEHV